MGGNSGKLCKSHRHQVTTCRQRIHSDKKGIFWARDQHHQHPTGPAPSWGLLPVICWGLTLVRIGVAWDSGWELPFSSLSSLQLFISLQHWPVFLEHWCHCWHNPSVPLFLLCNSRALSIAAHSAVKSVAVKLSTVWFGLFFWVTLVLCRCKICISSWTQTAGSWTWQAPSVRSRRTALLNLLQHLVVAYAKIYSIRIWT